MTTTIKLRNSVTTTNAPSTLQQGEVAINVTDSKVWVGNAATTPVQLLGAGATGSFSALSCTTLSASGVATFSAGTVSAPAITTTGDTNTGIFFPAADTIAFSEGGAEAMRINSSGNVGVGTTSPAITSGRNITIGSVEPVLVLNASSNRSYSIASGGNFTFTPSSLVFYDNTASAARMRIDSGGELILIGSTAQKATGTTWSNPSDVRLKNNIEDYAKGLPELMQVKVKTWEYNGKGGTTEGMKGLGVVADEIKEILPDTVDNYKAKLNEDDAEDSEIKKFDATEITWLLVKAAQEQQVMINELKATVDAQAARIAALESVKS
jgi:hypothetical protein